MKNRKGLHTNIKTSIETIWQEVALHQFLYAVKSTRKIA